MAYSLELEDHIERLLPKLGEVTKKKMFGGIGYLRTGNMCFGIHKDFLVIRTTKEQADKLLPQEGIKAFDITGRPMKGWIMADVDTWEDGQKLEEMLLLGYEFAGTLPAK